MARRPTSFDDLAESLGNYPWWAHVAAALIAFLLLRFISQTPPPDAGPFGEAAPMSLLVVVARVMKWVVPMPFLATAGLSVWSRNRGATLHEALTQDGGLTALRAMSWQAFLPLLAEAFRAEGFAVAMPDAGADEAGADLVLKAGAGTWCVQARQWRAPKVGIEQIQVLHGVMLAHGASAGVLVGTGMFTDEGIRWAAGLNIELLGGEDLLRRVRRARGDV